MNILFIVQGMYICLLLHKSLKPHPEQSCSNWAHPHPHSSTPLSVNTEEGLSMIGCLVVVCDDGGNDADSAVDEHMAAIESCRLGSL